MYIYWIFQLFFLVNMNIFWGKKIKIVFVCEYVYCVKFGKGLKFFYKVCESDRQKLILFNNFNYFNLLG